MAQDKGVEFAAMTDAAAALMAQGSTDRAAATLATFARTNQGSAASELAAGLAAHLRADHAEAVRRLDEANRLLGPTEYPSVLSPYSAAYLNAQLALPEHARPAVERGRSNYRSNLRALAPLDPTLAKEIEESLWPRDLLLVSSWGGLHLCSAAGAVLHAMSSALARDLEPHLAEREPIAFGGLGTGQEILYCLDRSVDLLHGMARTHYYVEPRADLLRAFFHLRDVSAAIAERRLIAFGGSRRSLRARQIFGTLRYRAPSVIVGDTAFVQKELGDIVREIEARVPIEEVRAYYASAGFRLRQRRIAAGQIQPSILVTTSRWTAFLKYCAADFERAFARLGCTTRFTIEENDVQTLLPALYWRELAEFKPDAVFMVSHARPSMPYLPRELAVISYVQDKCGPLLELPDLAGHIAADDLFVCLSGEHQRFLLERNVPRERTFIMPVPVDELMFHPLPEDHLRAPEYTVDASFVKHGTPHAEEAFAQFMRQLPAAVADDGLRARLAPAFEELYRATCLGVDRCVDEPELEEIVLERLGDAADPSERHLAKRLVAHFHANVFSPAWRYRFLEALDEAGVELALYGANWTKNKRLLHLDRGPVDRERELNYVYNFTRVNLSINHSLSMTHRLVECALAGGFIMAAAHPPEKDYAPAARYFKPERELILFGTPAELIERCRYFLDHPERRRAVARAMRERALRERTCNAGARTVLEKWRELVRTR